MSGTPGPASSEPDSSDSGAYDPLATRGILYPAKLPTMRRIPAPADLSELVHWFWIPRWQIPAGRVSRQNILQFPASNLVAESDGALGISGPSTRASHRDLTGTGWAIGALLRPAGVGMLGLSPKNLVDAEHPFDAPDLLDAVTDPMNDADDDTAATRFADWFRSRPETPDEQSLLANRLEDIVAADRSILRVDDLADRLGLSTRSLQRLTDRYVGVTPLAIIRRYRLQDAAELLRGSTTSIAEIAAGLGYADQAHFAGDFRTALGMPPSAYRRVEGGGDESR